MRQGVTFCKKSLDIVVEPESAFSILNYSMLYAMLSVFVAVVVSVANCLPSNATSTESDSSSKGVDDTLILWVLICAGGAFGLAVIVYFGCIRRRDEVEAPKKRRKKQPNREPRE